MTDPELPLDGLEPGEPHPCRLAVPLRFLSVFAGELAFLVFVRRALAVAVVGLVVEDEDPLHAHELGHDAAQHLSLALAGRDPGPASLEERAPSLGEGKPLAKHEGVVVRDDDLRLAEICEHVVRDELAALVVAVRIVRLKDAQSVSDGEPRGDDEEPSREPGASRSAHRVDRLPGDEHGHDGGLARARRELQGHSREPRVRLLARDLEPFDEWTRLAPEARCDFGEPDGGLDGLDLAEEGPDPGEFVSAPVLEQACRLRRHLPLSGIRDRSPLVHASPKAVDELHELVLLALGRELSGFLVEDDLTLALLLRPRDGAQEQCVSPFVADLARGLARRIKFPVPGRVLVRRVEDGLFEEGVGHASGA